MSTKAYDPALDEFARIMQITEEHCPRPIKTGVIVKMSDQYSSNLTESGLFVVSDTEDIDKKYVLGEVLAIGGEVKEVAVGDIILFSRSTAHRIPDGTKKPKLFKVDETTMAIIAVLKNDPTTVRGKGGYNMTE